MEEHPHYGFFCEQGTGKTLPVLVRILSLAIAGTISSALIICPRAVKASWTRDIETFFTPYEQEILNRTLSYKDKTGKRVPAIETYDTAWRRNELLRPWGMMVLDESHYIKDPGTNRYRGQKKGRVPHGGIQAIARMAQYRYILTGTPIGNSRWEHIFSQYDFLDPGIFVSWSAFKKKYCIMNEFFRPQAYRHVGELKKIFHEHSFRVTKAECLDLPEKMPPVRREFKFPQAERGQYNQMLKNYIAEYDVEAKNALARVVKLRQLCSGFLIDESGKAIKLKTEKLPYLNEFLENYEGKLVIFAEFKESIKDIRRLLERRLIGHAVLNGEQRDKSVWKQFQENPAVRVIVCQYRTANAGIDLFASATALYYEPCLSSILFAQSMDRIHRIGQHHPCSYILFQVEKSIEAKIWSALLNHIEFGEKELHEWVREESASRKRTQRARRDDE
jgi:SNF2 family DNA or RNA helicase